MKEENGKTLLEVGDVLVDYREGVMFNRRTICRVTATQAVSEVESAGQKFETRFDRMLTGFGGPRIYAREKGEATWSRRSWQILTPELTARIKFEQDRRRAQHMVQQTIEALAVRNWPDEMVQRFILAFHVVQHDDGTVHSDLKR